MKANSMLKFMFIPGDMVYGAVALSWFLIVSGWKTPNILNGYIGTGPDYQLAMYGGVVCIVGLGCIKAKGGCDER